MVDENGNNREGHDSIEELEGMTLHVLRVVVYIDKESGEEMTAYKWLGEDEGVVGGQPQYVRAIGYIESVKLAMSMVAARGEWNDSEDGDER